MRSARKMLALAQFFSNSAEFDARHARPTSAATTLQNQVRAGRITGADVEKYIGSTRIICHPTARKIAIDFLAHKRTHGTKTEKHVYNTQVDWNVDRFLVRLIKQRPLAFYGPADTTLLRDHHCLSSATSEWPRVGTDNEHRQIQMDDYLTYDEMMVSSLIGVSGYTSYINDGNRRNQGKIADPSSIQREGIQIGLVGARFEREGRMDCVYEDSNAPSTGQSSFFAPYFSGKDFESRYKARIRITLETLLMEADQRGSEVDKGVYLHVVGLGLGVWAIYREQPRWYVETLTQSLEALQPKHINTLELAWIEVDPKTKDEVTKVAAKFGIATVVSRRAPSARLQDQSLLLVTSYAWDSNAYPGNEYYLGMLSASGDPAAACSTAIAELHNPEINTQMLDSVHYLDS